MKQEHIYVAIDLKSFYASVECVERDLDPLTTNLVVADKSRTEKTICLAVSPALKSFGVPGRPRLFEVVQRVKEINAQRRWKADKGEFTGSSVYVPELEENPSLKLDYLVVPPRMGHYMKASTEIYQIYLKYVAPEDIHVYSIDEVFMDVTQYLSIYHCTARELAMRMILNVLEQTGITATAGIGTNLYLAKIAMDVEAKHIPADENGVRIAELDEQSYREALWDHRPLTDFWRVGRGYAKKLEQYGILTMGDIARCSVAGENEFLNEDLLYKLFGVNAELLIDHAWGYEPCTIEQIRAYRPESNSIGAGQVLQCPYDFLSARIVVREMAEALSLELVDKKLVTDQMVLTVGYDIENMKSLFGRSTYKGELTTDRYGRKIPRHAHGTGNIGTYTSSTSRIVDTVMKLYDEIVDRHLLIRRMNLVANRVLDEQKVKEEKKFEQLSLFDFMDTEKTSEKKKAEKEADEKERRMQEAMLSIKRKFGKNAIVKGTNLEKGATGIDRNNRIGGHKA